MFVNSIHARRAAVSVAVLGLLAAGCGGAEAPSDAAETSSVPAVAEAANDAASTADAVDSAGPADTRQAPETLAFAINAAETESFAFTQGLGINFGPAGVPFAQTEPYAFGEVADGETHVRVDLEKFVAQSMASLVSFGLGPELPVGQEFEVWIDNSTVTLDLQQLTSLETELAAASTGPVSVAVASLDSDALNGVDLSTVVRQFGQGSIATDPGALFEGLSTLDSMVMGEETVIGDVTVTEYTATVTVDEYYEAQGTTVEAQLGVVEMIALADESGDQMSEIIPALGALDLDVNIALDADGRLRRVASDLNVTDLVVTMFADSPELAGEDGEPAFDLAALFGPDGLQIVLSSWQEFHDYGDTVVIDAPAATDVTAEADSLFG